MKKLTIEQRVKRLEHLVYESENDNMIDCELLLQTIKDDLDDLPAISVHLDDYNLENGFVNVSVYKRKLLAEYEVVLDEDDGTLEVSCDGQSIGVAEDEGEAGDMIADHIMNEIMQY
jgi:hypothetical protein